MKHQQITLHVNVKIDGVDHVVDQQDLTEEISDAIADSACGESVDEIVGFILREVL